MSLKKIFDTRERVSVWTVCIMKDKLHSTMGDERLNGFMLMAAEKNIVKDLHLQTFVDTFALKPRKLKL